MVTISAIINGTVKLSDSFKVQRTSGNAVLIVDDNEKNARYNHIWIKKDNIIDNNGINVRYHAYKSAKWFFGAFNA
jgi:hypothetical protein